MSVDQVAGPHFQSGGDPVKKADGNPVALAGSIRFDIVPLAFRNARALGGGLLGQLALAPQLANDVRSMHGADGTRIPVSTAREMKIGP